MLGRCPALPHQRQQMRERFLVSAALLSGKLAGALVQLRGHFGRFFRRTAECNESGCEFRNFHGRNLD